MKKTSEEKSTWSGWTAKQKVVAVWFVASLCLTGSIAEAPVWFLCLCAGNLAASVIAINWVSAHKI